MRSYLQLESEKYYVEATRAKINTFKNRTAIHGFASFLGALLAIAGVFLLFQRFPNWLSTVIDNTGSIASRWV